MCKKLRNETQQPNEISGRATDVNENIKKEEKNNSIVQYGSTEG